jgi:hypothetical protein
MSGLMATASPLLAALAQARRRDAPMFTKWCELNGISAYPAAPIAVARFVSDCAALGIERLWPAVQEISRMHVAVGLADPTLGDGVADAIDRVARVVPPRSWPGDRKLRFKTLPYDLQVFVAAHEMQREKAIRRAQNEAASVKQQLAACQQKTDNRTNAPRTEKVEPDECDPHAAA